MKKLRIKITLKNSDPEIYRVIEVVDTINFRTLHKIIQAVFNWDDCHPYWFTFENLGIIVRKSTNYDYSSNYKIVKRRTPIGELLEEGVKFTYTYDMVAYWDHELEVISEFNSYNPNHEIVDFKGDNIPEDVGGLKKYYRLLKNNQEVESNPFDIFITQKELSKIE